MKSSYENPGMKFVTYIFLALAIIITLVPLYWMGVVATISQEQFFQFPPRLIPGSHFLVNFQSLQDRLNFLRAIGNSLFIAIIYTILSLFICSLAGFAFAKYEFKYKNALFYSILATLVLPIQLLVIPLFLLMANLNWINTFQAVILPWLAHPLGIFLMRQNMKGIPDGLLEAARLDGASEFQIFYRVVLPTMKSALAALAIILFLFQWNLFLYPLVVLQEESMYTIPVAFPNLIGQLRVDYGRVMVAATLTIFPMMVIFFWLQKHFVSGILAGSMKE